MTAATRWAPPLTAEVPPRRLKPRAPAAAASAAPGVGGGGPQLAYSVTNLFEADGPTRKVLRQDAPHAAGQQRKTQSWHSAAQPTTTFTPSTAAQARPRLTMPHIVALVAQPDSLIHAK
jgi:hypothetical protein